MQLTPERVERAGPARAWFRGERPLDGVDRHSYFAGGAAAHWAARTGARERRSELREELDAALDDFRAAALTELDAAQAEKSAREALEKDPSDETMAALQSAQDRYYEAERVRRAAQGREQVIVAAINKVDEESAAIERGY